MPCQGLEAGANLLIQQSDRFLWAIVCGNGWTAARVGCSIGSKLVMKALHVFAAGLYARE